MPASDVPGSGAPSVVEHGCRRVHDRVVRAVRSAARRAAGGGAHDRLIASSPAGGCDTRCRLYRARGARGFWPSGEVAWGLTEVH